MHCVNINNEQFKELAKKSNINPIILAAKVSIWQETNNSLDRFPTLEELNIPQVNSIKLGVQELFDSNPELANIGTKEQYSQYLNTIFPDSKVKDIVYHIGTKGIEKFDKSFFGKGEGTNASGNGFYFSTTPAFDILGEDIYYENENPIKAGLKSGRLYVSLLNIKNPAPLSFKKTLGNYKSYSEEAIKQNYDSLDNTTKYKHLVAGEYVVFEPEQIHILGNKQDIEGFKEFVQQPQITKQPVNYYDEPGFKERNPNFTHEGYISDVNKFGRGNNVELTDDLTPILNEREQVTSEETTPKLSKQTLEKVNEFLKRNGITVMEGDFEENTADLLYKTIDIVNGNMDVALPEEAFHFITEMVKQQFPSLYKEMFSKITSYNIYKQLLSDTNYTQSKNYKLKDGSLNIDKLKEEAIGKVLSQHYLLSEGENVEKPQLQVQSKKWYERILDWIKNRISKTYNPFEETINQLPNLKDEFIEVDERFNQFTNTPNDKQKAVFDAIIKPVADYNVQKPLKEGDSYTAEFNGVKENVGRTSEFAKQTYNKNHNKGKDPFANPTEEQKNRNDKLALNGTHVHWDIENMIKLGTTDEGMLKPINEIYTGNIEKFNSDAIYTPLFRFLFGTYDNGVHIPGYLYTQFPKGTMFKTETTSFNPVTKRAGTIDLLAIDPDGNIHIRDYKVMHLDLGRNHDIPFNKQYQHAYQMADYKRTAQQALKTADIKNAKVDASTIPIHATYKTSDFSLYSIQIGNNNDKLEERTYLIPVAAEKQTTGNTKVDRLIDQLKYHLDKVVKTKVGEQDYLEKQQNIKQLSIAIRNLQVLQFEPVILEIKNFLNYANHFFENMESTQDVKLLNDQIASLTASAEIYKNIEDVFFSEYKIDNVPKELVTQLQSSSEKVKELLTKIYAKNIEIQNKTSLTKGLTKDVSAPEMLLTSLLQKNFAEPQNQRIQTQKVFSTLYREASSLSTTKLNTLTRDYFDLLNKAGLSTAYDKLSVKDNTLIEKTSDEFRKSLQEAYDKGDIQFILKHIDRDKYDELSNTLIKQGLEKIQHKEDNHIYNANREDVNEAIAANERHKLENSLDVSSHEFNGFNDSRFQRLVWQSMNYTSDILSKEYSSFTKEEKELYEWHQKFNEHLYRIGYLTNPSTFSNFLPFVNASDLQKLAQGVSLKKVFKDNLYSKIEDGVQIAINPLTNKQLDEIPTLFTSTQREMNELSKDLVKTMGLLFASATSYQVKTNLESTFTNLLAIENAKGHLEHDKINKTVITDEEGKPKMFETNSNATILENYGRDMLYNITELDDSFFNIALGKTKAGEDQKANLKKGVQLLTNYQRAMDTGLKLLIAVPNSVGGDLQAFINGGYFYNKREFGINRAAVIKMSTPQKMMVDAFLPLNDNVAHHLRQNNLYKADKLKWLQTFSWQDVMQTPNRLVDLNMQYANALSFLNNTIIRDGKFYNTKQWVEQQPEFKKYRREDNKSVKEVETLIDAEVKRINKEEPLKDKISIVNNEYKFQGIEDLKKSNYGLYRLKIQEFGRKITGQLTQEEKLNLQRDTIFKSLLMYKTWIPNQVSTRGKDIKYNQYTEQWEYGRTRALGKVLIQYTKFSLKKLLDLRQGTPEGLDLIDKILEDKKKQYFDKYGEELIITQDQFYDVMRTQINNALKEVMLLSSLAVLLLSAKAMAPDDEDDDQKKNLHKQIAKAISKSMDEVSFYWSPGTITDMTQGNIIPQVSVVNRFVKVFTVGGVDLFDYTIGDEEGTKKHHSTKAILSVIPGPAQFMTEWFPVFYPEEAKELGYKVTDQARPSR